MNEESLTMSDGRCKTCKWWSKSPRGCERICEGPHLAPEYAGEDGIVPMPLTTRQVQFATGPTYGCVHHEPKDEEVK